MPGHAKELWRRVVNMILTGRRMNHFMSQEECEEISKAQKGNEAHLIRYTPIKEEETKDETKEAIIVSKDNDVVAPPIETRKGNKGSKMEMDSQNKGGASTTVTEKGQANEVTDEMPTELTATRDGTQETKVYGGQETNGITMKVSESDACMTMIETKDEATASESPSEHKVIEVIDKTPNDSQDIKVCGVQDTHKEKEHKKRKDKKDAANKKNKTKKEEQLRTQEDTDKSNQNYPLEDKICIASPSMKYLLAVKREISKMTNVTIFEKKISAADIEVKKGYFENAKMVILVATGSQKLLLISELEESQLGAAYFKATTENANVFLMLTAHIGSDDLQDDLYSPTLNKVFINQPEIGKLRSQEQFISLGYTYNPEELCFNDNQKTLIQEWIARNKLH